VSSTSAESYRKKRRFTVKTPSGDEFVIRKVPFGVMWKVLDKLGIEIPQGFTPEQAREFAEEKMEEIQGSSAKIIEIVDLVVPAVCITPKVTLQETENPDELSMLDIDPPDLMEIFGKAMEVSGASKEAVEDRESFRKESAGATDREDSSSSVQKTK